jgi:low affinity Fe/Cu permease
MSQFFSRFSNRVAEITGNCITFLVAVLLIGIWAISGPLFHFSTTWQLVINTATTIVTFLMVFLIQNTQNRDGIATQLKLDEIVRAIGQADNELIDSEDATEKELKALKEKYHLLAEQHRDLKSKLDQISTQGY